MNWLNKVDEEFDRRLTTTTKDRKNRNNDNNNNNNKNIKTGKHDSAAGTAAAAAAAPSSSSSSSSSSSLLIKNHPLGNSQPSIVHWKNHPIHQPTTTTTTTTTNNNITLFSDKTSNNTFVPEPAPAPPATTSTQGTAPPPVRNTTTTSTTKKKRIPQSSFWRTATTTTSPMGEDMTTQRDPNDKDNHTEQNPQQQQQIPSTTLRRPPPPPPPSRPTSKSSINSSTEMEAGLEGLSNTRRMDQRTKNNQEKMIHSSLSSDAVLLQGDDGNPSSNPPQPNKNNNPDDDDDDQVPTILDTSSFLTLSQSGITSPLELSSSNMNMIQSYGSKDVSDFEVTFPLPSWNNDMPLPPLMTDLHSNDDDDDNNNTSNSINCHGVFHVRILKAQRLPCPVGSTVYASMSLPPWQGRVRTERVPAFLVGSSSSSSSENSIHGVCVRWEQLHDQLSPSTDAGLCSMIHPWSSEESPIPSIHIELMFSPLGMGLFDFSMCSLTLGCGVLMQSPETWKTQWCQASVARLQTGSGKEYTVDDRVPLIQIEAMFAPTDTAATTTTTTTRNRKDDSALEGSVTTEGGVRSLVRPDPNDISSSRLMGEHYLEQSFSSVQQKQKHPTTSRDVTDGDDDDDEEDNDDITETSTLKSPTGTVMTQVPMLMNPANQHHHLRVLSFWMAGTCSVCSRLIMGRNGFHCEVCAIYCCSDCRLNVDLQLPCGSETARDIVEQSLQSKLTMGNLLSIVAPVAVDTRNNVTVPPNIHKNDHPKNSSDSSQQSKDPSSSGTTPVPRKLVNDFDDQEPGIGCLKLEFVRACLFERPLLAECELSSVTSSPAGSGGVGLRRGEYYARVTCNDGIKKTARTRTVQSIGTPQFGSDEMRFNVLHYGMEFRLEVIDAGTDVTVGTALITSQGILQEQRDLVVAEGGTPLLQCLRGPICFPDKRKVTLELRKGVKNGFSTDFFVPDKGSRESAGGKAGEISGWIEVNVGLEESVKRLYGKDPFECPPRPPDELNMVNFQLHIARIKVFIEDVMHLVDMYQYMVSWKDPFVTGISLVIFVSFCLFFNAEYSGSLPFLTLMVGMGHLAFSRKRGNLKSRFIRKEIEACRKAGKISLNYTLHRPVGIIDVAVRRGKNLVSLEFGLPGKTGCSVYWDPVRFATGKDREALMKNDRAAQSKHEIGFTEAHYAADPTWAKFHESAESKRLKQLLPNDGDFFETSSEHDKNADLRFPVLQPFKVIRSSGDDSNPFLDSVLRPWKASPGGIVIEIRFSDILNNLPGFNDVLGEVAIPFSKLVESENISGWFQVLEVGTTRVVPVKDDATKPDKVPVKPPEMPMLQQVYLTLKWTPPSLSTDPPPDERETSFAIQEEFVRSSVLARENKVDLVESSIGAINTALGISGSVQVVQNTLGTIMDVLEGVRNVFNFTDPFKSSILFVFVVVAWLFLVLIPTRYIVLSAGLGQYVVTFVSRFDSLFRNEGKDKKSVSFESKSETSGSSDNETPRSPVLTWIMNAVRGLPTDEDLRKTYFWESRRRGARESEKHASNKRLSRLERLWKAQWHSTIKMRLRSMSSSDSKMAQWTNVFAIIQGHRFLWWRTVQDFDNGELPTGRIFLSGHAGLTGPSPLEMREFSKEELPLIVTIFGRGITGQERITLLAPDAEAKDRLENGVIDASTRKTD